jgi:hypothetical protein
MKNFISPNQYCPSKIQGGITIPSQNSKSGLARFAGLFKRKKSTIKMVQEYMEFYYPSTGKIRYEIIFDWGEYIITTEDKADADVHMDSKPYLSYITFRPEVAKQWSKQSPSFYIITPEGEVWENVNGQGIPEVSTRQEVTKERTTHGVTTKTLTIQSTSEPIIDHFRAHPEQWIEYGKLEHRAGKTRLRLVE